MLTCQRDKFQLQGKISYLNCAYMSPMMKKVEKAGINGIMAKRKPYKIMAEDFFKDGETARLLFSQLINSPDTNRNVLIPSASYGLANVAKNLPKKKGEIVVVEGQFPSNIYPWMSEKAYKLVTIARPKDLQNGGKKWNEDILMAINQNTAAVAIGHVHWADGTLFDLRAIREATRKHHAALVIDGTQSVGALPFDWQQIQPDALICAGYKWLMGPYGLGMAYYGEMFDQGTPIENNWINRKDAENFAGLVNYKEQYLEGSLRYEVGEHSNFILLPMLIAAMKQIIKWDPASIQDYCEALMKDSLHTLRENGFRIADDDQRAHHLFGIRLPKNVNMETVQKQLKAKKVNVSLRGDAIRVSPHVYNQPKDVNRLTGALMAALHQ
ncbi:MAG: aminotransferase class V-fold PLP-dependent enzyme [Cyclobacteriaceae bacterium]|nr:aminotransferase class V-fold PLP-dependent enzyme [Cyclobacteriaceae bacterium]